MSAAGAGSGGGRCAAMHRILAVPDHDPPSLAVLATGGMRAGELLDLAARTWSADGRQVVRCSGRRGDADAPLAAIGELLRARDVPLGERLDGRAMRDALLETLAGRAAVLLVAAADRLDAASVRVLVGVAERSAERDVAMVVGHRPARRRTDIAALDAALGSRSSLVWLEPLTHAELCERVAARIQVRPEPAFVECLSALTDGVPRYVDWALATWDPRDVGQLEAIVRDEAPLPRGLAALVGAEVAQLPTAARRLLVARRVDRALDDHVLQRVLDLTPEALDDANHSLWSAGLTSPRRRGVVPLVAAAVDELFPIAERRALHRRVADALTEMGARARAIAPHLLAAA